MTKRTQADRDEDLALGRELERKDNEIANLRAEAVRLRSYNEGLVTIGKELEAQRAAEEAVGKRLAAENEKLRAALKSFAEAAKSFMPYPAFMEGNTVEAAFTLAEMRAAREAYEQYVTETETNQ